MKERTTVYTATPSDGIDFIGFPNIKMIEVITSETEREFVISNEMGEVRKSFDRSTLRDNDEYNAMYDELLQWIDDGMLTLGVG